MVQNHSEFSMDEERTYDTLHMGRSGIDLYAREIGVPFEAIQSFAAYVGGSPTNISVGGRRLGLKTALLTGLGRDPDPGRTRGVRSPPGFGSR